MVTQRYSHLSSKVLNEAAQSASIKIKECHDNHDVKKGENCGSGWRKKAPLLPRVGRSGTVWGWRWLPYRLAAAVHLGQFLCKSVTFSRPALPGFSLRQLDSGSVGFSSEEISALDCFQSKFLKLRQTIPIEVRCWIGFSLSNH